MAIGNSPEHVSKRMPQKQRQPIMVSPTVYTIALDEARALRAQAQATHSRLSAGGRGSDGTAELGAMLAALVTIGLSLEFYLKAFMAIARGGHVTAGHNLGQLYGEFPPFLKVALEERYARLIPREQWVIRVIGLRMSPVQPQVPDDNAANGHRYGGFEDAIRSLANSFTRARYFYEEVSDRGWSVFEYAIEPGLYLADVIDGVFKDWQAGAFKD